MSPVNLPENILTVKKTTAQGSTKFTFTKYVTPYSVSYLKLHNTHK